MYRASLFHVMSVLFLLVTTSKAMRYQTRGLALDDATFTCLKGKGAQTESLVTGRLETCDFLVTEQSMQTMMQRVVAPVLRYTARAWHTHPKEPREAVYVRPWHWLCSKKVMSLVPPEYQYASDAATNTDFLLLVTFQALHVGLDADYYAFGRVCQHHPVSNRPTIAILNIADDGDTNVRSLIAQQTFVLHEMVHIHAMSEEYWASSPTQFVNPDKGYERLPRELVINFKTRPEGHKASYIITPRVVAFLRKNTECDSVLGAELEDDGVDSGLPMNHWESRLYTEDIQSVKLGSKITNLTLAMLEDTGWVVVDYVHAQAGMLVKGYRRGCQNLNLRCSDLSIQEDTTDFCIHDYSFSRCTADKRSIGWCFLLRYSQQIPYMERYFPRFDNIGGFSYQEYCPARFDEVECAENEVCVDRPIQGARSGRSSRCLVPICRSVNGKTVVHFNIDGVLNRCPENGLPGRTFVNDVQLPQEMAFACTYPEVYCSGNNKYIDFNKHDLTFTMTVSPNNAMEDSTLDFNVFLTATSAPAMALVEVVLPADSFTCTSPVVGPPDSFQLVSYTPSTSTLRVRSLLSAKSLVFTVSGCKNPARSSEDPGAFLIAVKDPESGEDIGYSFDNPAGDAIADSLSRAAYIEKSKTCVPIKGQASYLSIKGEETFTGFHAVRLELNFANLPTLGKGPHFLRLQTSPPYFHGSRLNIDNETVWTQETLFLFRPLSAVPLKVKLIRNEGANLPQTPVTVILGDDTKCFSLQLNLNILVALKDVSLQVHPVPQCPRCISTLFFRMDFPKRNNLEAGDVISLRMPFASDFYKDTGFRSLAHTSVVVNVTGAGFNCPTTWPARVMFPVIDITVACRTSPVVSFSLGPFWNPLSAGDPGSYGVIVTRGERLLFMADMNPTGDYIHEASTCGRDKCNGHGTCDKDNSCACLPGFGGLYCNECLPEYYPPGVCNETCMGNLEIEDLRGACNGKGELGLSKNGTCGCICDSTDLMTGENCKAVPAYSIKLLAGLGRTSWTVQYGKAIDESFIVILLNSDGTLDTNNSVIVITATSSQGILTTTSGDHTTSVTMVNGKATFSSLSFDGCITGGAELTFTAGSQGETMASGKAVGTGAGSIRMRSPGNAKIAFLRAPPESATHGLLFPLAVKLLDICGNDDLETNGTTMTVVPLLPNNQGVAVVSHGDWTKTVVLMGIATFNNFRFGSCTSITNGTRLVFNAEGCTDTLISSLIVVTSRPNAAVRFVNSFKNRTVFAFKPIDPPIQVQLLDSCGVKDTSYTGAYVSVKGLEPPGTERPSNITATFLSGIATFINLNFLYHPPAAQLTFTVSPATEIEAANQTLDTGYLHVLPLPAFNIRFSANNPQGFTAARNMTTLTTNEKFRPITVELVDSAGNPDTQKSGIVVSATADVGTLVGNTSAVMINGTATFSHLGFDSCLVRFDGTDTGTTPTAAMCTDFCTARGYCCNNISFSSNQMLSCMQSCMIRVRGTPEGECLALCDRQSSLGCSISQSGFQYPICGTCSDLHQGCPLGVQSENECKEGCRLVSTPSATIFLTVGPQGATPAAGKALKSGAIRVLPEPNYGLKFSPPFQARSYKRMRPLPEFSVVFTDSCGATDATSNGNMTITAVSSTKGVLLGTIQKVINGTATFPALTFTEDAGNPVLTFVASHGPYAVAGKNVTTPSLRLVRSHDGMRFHSNSSVQPVVIELGRPLSPSIVIEMLDSDDNFDPLDSSNIFVKAYAGSVMGESASFSKGLATFSSLTLSECMDDGVTPVLTFVAGSGAAGFVTGSEGVLGKTLTKKVTVRSSPAFHVAFGQPPPTDVVTSWYTFSPTVTVRILDYCRQLDTQTTGLKVLVVSSSGTLSGASADVVNGSATFRELKFIDTPFGPVTLTFQVVGDTRYSASGKSLLSTIAKVRPAPSFAFRLRSVIPLTIPPKTAFEPIVFENVDSAGSYDATNSETVITVEASSGILQGVNATMVKGLATFSTLLFTVCPKTANRSSELTFFAGPQGTNLLRGKKIVTNPITVVAPQASQRIESLRFGKNMSLTAAVGTAMPPFTLEIIDSCDFVDMSQTQGSALATATCGSLAGAAQVPVVKGVITFSKLTFETLQSEEVKECNVTFSFGALSLWKTVYVARRISPTGFTTKPLTGLLEAGFVEIHLTGGKLYDMSPGGDTMELRLAKNTTCGNSIDSPLLSLTNPLGGDSASLTAVWAFTIPRDGMLQVCHKSKHTEVWKSLGTFLALPCNTNMSCSGRGVGVRVDENGKCMCTCKNKFVGASCNVCPPAFAGNDCNSCASVGFVKNYPQCSLCSADHNCSKHGDATAGNNSCTCSCYNQWTGASCESCPPQFMGTNCDQCALDRVSDYPLCSKCTVAEFCQGRATMTNFDKGQCTCACRNQWKGQRCSECPSSYTGKDCDQCAEGLVSYPKCVQCNSRDNCNGHQALFDKDTCLCVCSGRWTGADCGTCPKPFGGPNCDQCGSNREKDYPTCSPLTCNTATMCSNHALTAVRNTTTDTCLCECMDQWTGAQCSECPDRYDAATCNRCAEGRVDNYPTCSKRCTDTEHCSGRSSYIRVVSDSCLCRCQSAFTGQMCDRCAEGYENYPNCTRITPAPTPTSSVTPQPTETQSVGPPGDGIQNSSTRPPPTVPPSTITSTPEPPSVLKKSFFSLQILQSVFSFSNPAFVGGVVANAGSLFTPENVKIVSVEQLSAKSAPPARRETKTGSMDAVMVWFQFVNVKASVLEQGVEALRDYVDAHSTTDQVFFGDIRLVYGSSLGTSLTRPPGGAFIPGIIKGNTPGSTTVNQATTAKPSEEKKGTVTPPNRRGIMVIVLCISAGLIALILVGMAMRIKPMLQILHGGESFPMGRARQYEMTAREGSVENLKNVSMDSESMSPPYP